MYFWFLLAFILLLILYFYVQNRSHQVTRYNIFISKMHPEMKGKKIIFLSDLHFRENVSHAFLDRIIIEIEELKPDIILFGGDMIHRMDTKKINGDEALEHVKDFFFQLSKVASTHVIFGNHDLGCHRLKEVETMLKMAGANVLKNDANWISFGHPSAGFWLMGLSEHMITLTMKEDALAKIQMPKTSKNEPKILLAHYPDFFEKYLHNEYTRPDLVLTGHAHGGQVILPIIGGLFAPGQGANPKYDFGIFTSETYPDSRMILTRGIGNSSFPLRVNNRPEIVEIVFE